MLCAGVHERVLAAVLAALPLLGVPCALTVHYSLWVAMLVAVARVGTVVCRRWCS